MVFKKLFKFLTKLFQILNYDDKNIDNYKDETTNEFLMHLGLASEIDLQKNEIRIHTCLRPKIQDTQQTAYEKIWKMVLD